MGKIEEKSRREADGLLYTVDEKRMEEMMIAFESASDGDKFIMLEAALEVAVLSKTIVKEVADLQEKTAKMEGRLNTLNALLDKWCK